MVNQRENFLIFAAFFVVSVLMIIIFYNYHLLQLQSMELKHLQADLLTLEKELSDVQTSLKSLPKPNAMLTAEYPFRVFLCIFFAFNAFAFFISTTYGA